MANLFQENLDANDVAQILAASPLKQPLPPAGSKTWEAVAKNPAVMQWMAPIIERTEAERRTFLPELTDAHYREFHANGSRLNFESIYFERRRRLSRAAMCALLDKNEPKWLESLKQKMNETLDEFSWALPAHVNSPSGKDSMNIDLYAAETASIMAELITAFATSLGGELIGRVRSRLHIQFFENYVNRHEDLSWTLNSGNWNPVCHQGVIGAALSVEEDLVMLSRMIMLARKYLPIFLGGFGKDGACSEGPGYWEYGFGWFAMLNEQLEVRTNGQLSLFEDNPKILQIARYGPRASLNNCHFVNFSDSPRSGFLNPALLSYLGDRLGDDYLRKHALINYKYLEKNGLNPDAQQARFFFLSRLFLRCPSELPDKVEIEYEDTYFKDLGVLIARGHDSKNNFWEFAVKGGDNNEHHNHNDCGSYLLNINGEPMIIEIGSPEYTKDYFREKRYEVLAARTMGHSLPIVNGFEQAAGPHYTSKVLTAETDEEHVHFIVDITRAYPPDSGCGEIMRDIKWDKERGVMVVKDYYELTKFESFESSIITDKEVTINGDEAVLQGEGCRIIIRLLTDTLFTAVQEHEYRNHAGVQVPVRRIILTPDNLKEQTLLSYEISIGE